jgi:hypothetical protein
VILLVALASKNKENNSNNRAEREEEEGIETQGNEDASPAAYNASG